MPKDTPPEVQLSPLSNQQRLMLRLSRYRGRMVTIQVIVDQAGEPLAWFVLEDVKIEGMTKDMTGKNSQGSSTT